MLTEKERLVLALERKAVDRPPCICPGGMMNLITRDLMEQSQTYWPEAHLDPVKMARLSKAAHEANCFENYGLPFCLTIESEAMGASVDLGTQSYEPRVSEYAINSVSEWSRLQPIDCSTGRAKVVLEAIAILKAENGDVPIIGNLTGPISAAGSVLDPVILYKEMRRKREDCHALMDFVTRQILEFGLKQLEAGADIIAISDPSGTGEILGPLLFEEYAVPYLNMLTRAMQERFPDSHSIVHICGKMHKVFGPLAGVDCHALSFDAIVNMRKAKDLLPQHAVMGNVSCFALEFNGPERISRITQGCIRSGVDVISPACGLGNTTPLANMQAILNTVRQAAAPDTEQGE